jgi:hypothetical protein
MEVRDGTIWDGATEVAAFEPSSGAPGAVSLRMITALTVGRDAARAMVDAVTRADVPVLDVADALLRGEARAIGWTGTLRGPLTAPSGPIDALDVVATVEALLPGVQVAQRGRSRQQLSLRAKTTDGLGMKVKVPDRPDVMPEMLAAALDTALSVRRRFGRMASGVRGIAIDDGAGGFDDHRTAGSASSSTGTFFLDTMLACADAMDAQRLRMAGGRGVSAAVARPWFQIDGVVAHEYWHNLDTTVVASPAVYLEINRALGVELGVETYEHALRGRDQNAPPAWQLAFGRIVTEVSPYATTNWRESTAELFKLWWCRPPDAPPAPLVACFGALLERFYPPPT